LRTFDRSPGGNSEAIVALLTATAGGIAEAAWLTSKPEQRAWAAGYNAITCAQTAVEPLRVIFAAPGAPNPSLDTRESAVRNALGSLDEALGARQDAARIPAQLIDTVDNIGGQVAVALTEQGPDAQALARLGAAHPLTALRNGRPLR
jgi:hypothetical protein